MLLNDAYQELLRLNLRIRSPKTMSHYRLFLRFFSDYLGQEPLTEHLTEDHHSGFARWLLDRGLAEVSVNQRLHYMRALWRHCARRGYVTIWPTSQDIPEPERMPVAWTESELLQLWQSFDRIPGYFCGVRKSSWWRAFHEVIYWTGERCGAVLAIEWTWLRGDRLNIPAKHRKGGRKSRSYWLPERALVSLDQIRQPPRKLVFPISRSAFYTHYHRLLRIADLDGKRRGPQQMRRTHASFLAKGGGDATRSLGHSTRRVTELYYLDPSIAEARPLNADLPDLPKGTAAGPPSRPATD